MGSNQPATKMGGSGGRREDRLHSRHQWHNEVQVAWINSPGDLPNEPHRLHAQDISAGGIALRSRCMVHPGQLGVVLLGKGSEDALTRGIEVRHCAYDDKLKQHVVGCGWVAIPNFIKTDVVVDRRHGMRLAISVAERASYGAASGYSMGVPAEKNSH